MKEDQWLDVEVPRRVVPLGLEKVSGYPFGETIFGGKDRRAGDVSFQDFGSGAWVRGSFCCDGGGNDGFFVRKTFCLFIFRG